MAHYWGLIPSQYRACSDQDKLEMIAYMESQGEIRAVEDYPIRKKIEEQQKKNKARTR